MLIITIELAPGGDMAHKQHLGTATIINDGTGTLAVGNYEVRLSKWGRPGVTWRRGRIEGFPRQRLGPYDLLLRALQVTVGGRNRDQPPPPPGPPGPPEPPVPPRGRSVSKGE